jgi:hypothetical protein
MQLHHEGRKGAACRGWGVPREGRERGAAQTSLSLGRRLSASVTSTDLHSGTCTHMTSYCLLLAVCCLFLLPCLCCLVLPSGREPLHVETAISRALDAYYGGQQWWREQLVPRAMRQDWSWSRSAATYLDIYRSML